MMNVPTAPHTQWIVEKKKHATSISIAELSVGRCHGTTLVAI